MSTNIPDDLLAGLIRRAAVPKGFRPRTSEELDLALNAMGDVDIDPQRVLSIVDRILSDEPIVFGRQTAETGPDELVGDCENLDELVEMFRSEGDIPPDIAERLRELESEANREADEEDDEESNGQ